MSSGFIHPDDEQTLQRILRTNDIPTNVVEECQRWTRAYHGAGHGGPIGTLALISVVRLCGVELPAIDSKPKQTAWSNVPVNTRVEAHFFGSWQQGTFLGLGPGGVLAVRVDMDGQVRECYPHVVRLPGGKSDIASLPPSPAMKDVLATAEVPQSSKAKKAAAESVEPEKPPEAKPFDWSKANRGDLVWAERDGDVCDARFERVMMMSNDGSGDRVETLLVVFDGEDIPQEVPAASSTLAS